MNNRKFTRYVLCASIFTATTFLTVSCAGRNSDAPSSMDETPIVSSETTGEPNEASIPEISENTTLQDNDTETTPEEITTEEAIEEVVAETEPIVYFSSKSGFYDNGFTLELRCPVENAVIYYTTDGTIPTQDSRKYEEPISLTNVSLNPDVYAARTDYCTDSQYVPMDPVTKANIIRAVAYFEDGTSSVTTNGTYFVGIDREELYGDSPVISLITEPDNLFDNEKGIFVLGQTYTDWLAEDPANADEPSYRVHGNFSNKGRDWERPVSFEYMPSNGKNVSADMGLRMKGASTRTYLQKSMRLIARAEYGTKSINADLIPGNMKSDNSGPITSYKSFVLRNGGNDNGFSKMRDPVLQSLVADRAFDTQASAPCVVFVDGEYWGLYAITEDYNDKYIETNYGIDNKNVVIVKCGRIDEGTAEDITLYEDMYNFITQNDMTDEKNYAKAQEMLDIPGFIDFCAVQLYIDNNDSIFDDNNWSMWRTREADKATEWSDGKWRILLYDTEFSTGVYSGGKGFEENTIKKDLDASLDADKKYSSDYPALDIFRSLYENGSFRKELIVTLCDLRNYNYEKKRAGKAIDNLAVSYKKLADDSFYRYGPDWVVMYDGPTVYYDTKIKEFKQYMNGRYMAFPNLMKKTFSLKDPCTIKITVSDPEYGDVLLNRTDIDFSNLPNAEFTGDYFEEYEITLTAAPKEGHTFVKWIVGGDEFTDDTITLTPYDKCTIEVQYK